MRPIAGTKVYGVHKDLTGDMIDNPETVSTAYEFVWSQGLTFLLVHPELTSWIVDQTVVDIVFEKEDGSLVQRIEWQCLVREG